MMIFDIEMIFDIDPVKFNTIMKDLKMYDEDDDGFYDMEIEDDGQPSEYDEWQDVYDGDDWDHGQFDEF
jgi:hypothetical protein